MTTPTLVTSACVETFRTPTSSWLTAPGSSTAEAAQVVVPASPATQVRSPWSTASVPAGSVTVTATSSARVPPVFARSTVSTPAWSAPSSAGSSVDDEVERSSGAWLTTTSAVSVPVTPAASVTVTRIGYFPLGTRPGGATSRSGRLTDPDRGTVTMVWQRAPGCAVPQSAQSAPDQVIPSGRSTTTRTSVPVVRPVLVAWTAVSMGAPGSEAACSRPTK